MIGRPVEEIEGGEEIVAFIQPVPESPLTVAQLTEHARATSCVTYKRPSQIVFRPGMPLTPTGKIMKDELRQDWIHNIMRLRWDLRYTLNRCQ